MNGYEIGRLIFFESAHDAFKRTMSDDKQQHLKGGGKPISPTDMAKRRKILGGEHETARRKKLIQRVQGKRKIVMKKRALQGFPGQKASVPQPAATPINRVAQSAGAQAGKSGFMKHLKKNRYAYGAGLAGMGAMSMLN